MPALATTIYLLVDGLVFVFQLSVLLFVLDLIVELLISLTCRVFSVEGILWFHMTTSCRLWG